MVCTSTIAAATVAILMLSPTAFAQQPGGNAYEAKVMLVKAVAAVKADKTKTLDVFNKGEGGFLDRDLNQRPQDHCLSQPPSCKTIAWPGG